MEIMKHTIDNILTGVYFLLNIPLLQTGEGYEDLIELLFRLSSSSDGALKYIVNLFIGITLLALTTFRAMKAYIEWKDQRDARIEKKNKAKRKPRKPTTTTNV